MTTATWIAILVLGPGSVIVFVLFLRDVGKVLGGSGGSHRSSDRS